MTARVISHSETETLLDCPLKWDFAYGGNLLGFCITPRDPNIYLRRGKAWGIGVAEWHLTGNLDTADAAMLASIERDAVKQQAAGTYDPEAHAELWTLLRGCLADYSNTAERIPGYRNSEHEINVRLPGRNGGKSSRYRLVAKLDALAGTSETYIVEHKFRGQLTTLEDIMRARQFRWYAWAHREETGEEIRGVIVDERLAEIPSPVRFNGDGSVSRVQSCTPDAYISAFEGLPAGEIALSKNGKRPLKGQTCSPRVYLAGCQALGVEPDEETITALYASRVSDPEILATLAGKRWQNREVILFSPREIDEAGEQTVSAARLIQLHESGDLYPIRNGNASKCRNCFARDVCLTPTDAELAHALFDVRPAKRNRPNRELK